jgi:predicted ABC-type ATPase
MPTLYLITGSNGAGKSTVGPDYLPNDIKDNYRVFDGDKLYMSKSRELFPTITKSPKEAKKLAGEFVIETLERLVEEALANRDNFVYEGHFPSYATWNFPKRFKDNGYKIKMLFLGLANVDISEMRVGIRTKKGGHNVPRWDIENNFYGNLEMLNDHYQLLDHLQIVDTSEFLPKPLGTFHGENVISCINEGELPQWFTKYLPHLTLKIKTSNSSRQ